MSNEFKLGMGQMLVHGGMLQANLQRACRMISSAAAAGCAVVVLPECLDAGWTHPSAPDLACAIPGPTSDVLCEAARSSGIYVAAGITERADLLCYNAAILISPDGEILLKHRKINELEVARQLYATGTSVQVARTPLATFGLTICADNFPQSLALSHAAGQMGAQVMLSPCAWAVDADHDNGLQPYGGLWQQAYRELALRHRMTVVGVSNVGAMTGGVWAGRKCIGCSLAVGPEGVPLAQGPYGHDCEALIEVTVVPV